MEGRKGGGGGGGVLNHRQKDDKKGKVEEERKEEFGDGGGGGRGGGGGLRRGRSRGRPPISARFELSDEDSGCVSRYCHSLALHYIINSVK